MVEIVWSEPALADLDAIADYAALDNPNAAAELVRRVFAHVEHLPTLRTAAAGPSNSGAGATGRWSSRPVACCTATSRGAC